METAKTDTADGAAGAVAGEHGAASNYHLARSAHRRVRSQVPKNSVNIIPVATSRSRHPVYIDVAS